MRKWIVPLLILGAASVGAFFLTSRGRLAVRGLWIRLEETPERWKDWTEGAQLELARIQNSLNEISQSLESASSGT